LSVITINQLSITFNARPIIVNFSASIESGDFIGIFGSNGAGKSTLLKSILGLIKPTSGTILLSGKLATRGNVAIGYMPQIRQLLHTNQLSGRARLLANLQGTRYGLPTINHAAEQQVNKILDLVNANHFADLPFNKLSGGERQRLLLAQALLNAPKILLLDEPLASLDPHQQENLIALIEKLRKKLNITILFTAHDFNPLMQVMSKIIYLANGRAAIGAVNEIVTPEKLSWLYGVEMDVINHQGRLLVVSHAGSNQCQEHPA